MLVPQVRTAWFASNISLHVFLGTGTERVLLLGASEPRNMAYMNRLGIWGEGTPFREFSDFIQAVERR